MILNECILKYVDNGRIAVKISLSDRCEGAWITPESAHFSNSVSANSSPFWVTIGLQITWDCLLPKFF